MAVIKYRIPHRLARAHDGLQSQPELLAHAAAGTAGISLHHGFERGREQKGVGHAKALHQLKRRLRAKAAAVGHDWATKVQGGQQRVHQAAGPGPVRRAPEHGGAVSIGAAVKAKPVLAADKAAQVADQRAVWNQRALRVACGAAGVNQHGGLVGQRVHRRKVGGCAGQRGGVVQISPVRCRAHAQHLAQLRAVAPHGQQVVDGTLVADRQHRLAVLQPVVQRVRAKQHGQRHGHRPHLQHRHVGHRRLKPLRHHNRHPVAPRHTQPGEHLRQPVGLRLQLGIGIKSG